MPVLRSRPSMEPGDSRPDPRRPIIIVGTGRCGSTLLHRLLARHETLGWLSTFNEVLPTQTWLSTFSALYRTPLPERLRHAKAFPKPFEAYRFWERFLPGFSRRDRPLTAADVPDSGIEPVRRATASVLRFQRRDRLLVKVTGWSRIAYFDRIYPGAQFVSLHRDPRAVVSSWEQADWLDVSSAPDSEGWQWGEVPERHLEAWRSLGGGPLLSAALKIRLDLDDIARNAELVPGRFHELTYEDLVRYPEPTLRSLCEACDLGWTSGFDSIVRATAFYDSTGTWRKHLSEEQGSLVLEFMERTEPAEPREPQDSAR
jgi:omega-hydroxy-beta-dihydromenaquinone-9 sulfotransferase